ncbi:Hypothetical protein, putative [Bodo saltans]|uniref:Uncharacterized protein n=1 Tax=Bodo saltans TaxID=75058 RepID=A0A0S4IQW7_BODSA|nr:Hypothetical protein, putative [Bodo saltans]|eukprot:CUF24647.1 Hypothetical protein, putative [Bodo saltans]
MSSSPTAELTAEEEADLLAVYGTHNPFYDELLQLQAPSQYRSIYESRNLFLTTGDDDGVNRPVTSSGSIEIDALDCVGPLDLFVLRHLNSGSVAARPSSYSDALTLAVESLQGTQFSDGSGAGPLEQCRNAISAVEGGMNIHWALSKAEGGDDADAFDRELQQLIADAESEINHRNFHYDPATDPVFQARLKELQERELTPLNDEAFEDDGELLDQAELATIEAAAEERCRLAPVLLPDEAEELAQLRANDEIAAVKKAKNLDMHKVHMDVMEKLGHEERSKIPKKDSDEIETIEALLEKIKTIDLRDAELQEHAKEEVRRVAAASAHLVAEDFHQEHQQGASSKGLVVFEDIAKKIDKFFPPPADITESYTTSLQQQGASGASLATKQPRKTLQDLRKASARLEVLAKFEAVEPRLMRDEEERVNAWQRNIDAQRITQSNDRDALTTSEDVKRRHILGEEAVAHVEVLVREERQRNNLVQLLQQRDMHQRAMVMSELSEAYDQIRSIISNVEAYEWTDLSSSERSERQALLSHAQQIEEMLREMERTMILEQAESIRVSWAALLEASQARTEFIIAAALTTDAYGDRYPNTFESSALQRLAHCDSCGFGTRCEQLIAAAVTKSQWTQLSKTETATALQALGVALHAALIGGKNVKKSKSFRASPPPPRTPTPPMTPLPTSVKDSDSTCVKLNDRLARKLLPFENYFRSSLPLLLLTLYEHRKCFTFYRLH